MCRHAAWLGAPRRLGPLLLEPAHGLLRQSYAPRLQRCGRVNADGFGFGWYDPGLEEPVRYRRTVPIWTDANVPALATCARSACLVAAVRSATPGMPVEESATAPFSEGRWLLSHNGRVERKAVRDLADGREPESVCDSAWLAAAVFARLASGGGLADAVADVVTGAAAADPDARLNLLVADGGAVVATAWNETLFTHRGEGLLVASEPLDDRPGWCAVPDRHIVHAGPGGVRVDPL
ncbi:ergothioneine biosynthesis protein EgtC [Sphaerisporangium fuscum]|uniref:ergothioneine biosynthesis protein EgtC n=1 Tax=Sphaerisporangium fuscum TaxID=2835868 RepID=UPI001BDCF829|nr:ergothioneine biosynthesis protein EgtC [Sphaerisporangium fuscum]